MITVSKYFLPVIKRIVKNGMVKFFELFISGLYKG
jgi:hypothetical protein